MATEHLSTEPYRYGWKIHLTVPHDPDDPLTKRVVDFCRQQGITHKVGTGGYMEDGKGATLYVGARDRMESLAQELHHLDLAPHTAQGEVLETDHRVMGNVWARFDPCHVEPGRGLIGSQIEPFHTYGSRGVPNQTQPILFLQPRNRTVLVAKEFIDGQGQIFALNTNKPSVTSPERMRQLSHRALLALFGDFYTGSADVSQAWMVREGFEPAETYRKLRPLGYFTGKSYGNIPGTLLEGYTTSKLEKLAEHTSMKWFKSAVECLKDAEPAIAARITPEPLWADRLGSFASQVGRGVLTKY